MRKLEHIFSHTLKELIKPEKYMPIHFVREMEHRAQRTNDKEFSPVKQITKAAIIREKPDYKDLEIKKIQVKKESDSEEIEPSQSSLDY